MHYKQIAMFDKHQKIQPITLCQKHNVLFIHNKTIRSLVIKSLKRSKFIKFKVMDKKYFKLLLLVMEEVPSNVRLSFKEMYPM